MSNETTFVPPLNPFLILQRYAEGKLTPKETEEYLTLWKQQADVKVQTEDDFMEAQGWIRIEKAIDRIALGLLPLYGDENDLYDGVNPSYQQLRQDIKEALLPEEDWGKYP